MFKTDQRIYTRFGVSGMTLTNFILFLVDSLLTNCYQSLAASIFKRFTAPIPQNLHYSRKPCTGLDTVFNIRPQICAKHVFHR
jgi:hypothetical protein